MGTNIKMLGDPLSLTVLVTASRRLLSCFNCVFNAEPTYLSPLLYTSIHKSVRWLERCAYNQGYIFRLRCSHPELTEDHVLTSAYVKMFRTVTRNAVNKIVWRKKDCFLLPLNKHAMNIWLSSLRIRAHLSWRTGKHLHVLRTYSTCSFPGYQDTTTYAALGASKLQYLSRRHFPDFLLLIVFRSTLLSF